VLQAVDGSEQFEATDDEPEAQGERLELLALVRGLEALPRPARVTLVTPSKYVNRGLAYGLEEWRSNDWQWEHFGEMVPVKNRDLWQRVDRALEFHQLECRAWRFDLPHAAGEDQSEPTAAATPARTTDRGYLPGRWIHGRLRRYRTALRHYVAAKREAAGLWLAQLGTRFLPLPWLEP
jgi:ribonuclease HI